MVNAKKVATTGLLCLLLGVVFGLPWLAFDTDKDVTNPLLSVSAKHAFVFFGFTSCHGVCPMTLNQLANLDEGLLQDAVQVLYVDIEKHGDHQAADQYAKSFHHSFNGVAPSEAELAQMKRDFGLNIVEGESSIQHQGRLYLVENKGTKQILSRVFNPLKFSPESLNAQLLKLGS